MTEPVPARLIWLVLGFTLWASAFITLYSLQALGCAYGWPDVVHRGALMALFAAHLVVIGVLLMLAWRRPQARFLDRVIQFTLWAALVSTLLNFAPALVLTACATP